MKKILFVAFASLAFLAVPASAKTKTKATNVEVITNSGVDNYNGYRAFSGSEHSSSVDVKTKGSALGAGLSSNNAVANSNVAGAGGVISGNVGATGAGIAGSIQAGAANTAAQSGSVAVAGSLGTGSSRVESGGYAVGSAGVRNEWGTNVTNGVSTTTTKTRTTN
jgi:hypothetical protein